MNITNQFVTPKCPNSTSLIDVSAKDIYSKIKLVVLFAVEDARSGNPIHN
jgi:hypothetical protein